MTQNADSGGRYLELHYGELARRVGGFTADMESADIHVGLSVLGLEPVCCCCHEPWPCSTERAARDA